MHEASPPSAMATVFDDRSAKPREVPPLTAVMIDTIERLLPNVITPSGQTWRDAAGHLWRMCAHGHMIAMCRTDGPEPSKIPEVVPRVEALLTRGDTWWSAQPERWLEFGSVSSHFVSSCQCCNDKGRLECDDCMGTGFVECGECGQEKLCDECEKGMAYCVVRECIKGAASGALLRQFELRTDIVSDRYLAILTRGTGWAAGAVRYTPGKIEGDHHPVRFRGAVGTPDEWQVLIMGMRGSVAGNLISVPVGQVVA